LEKTRNDVVLQNLSTMRPPHDDHDADHVTHLTSGDFVLLPKTRSEMGHAGVQLATFVSRDPVEDETSDWASWPPPPRYRSKTLASLRTTILVV
jgi:hypothetical protein